MNKIFLGLIAGIVGFVAGMIVPYLVAGVAYFLVPHILLKVYFSMTGILALIYGMVAAYKLSKNRYVAIVTVFINLVLISSWMYPKYLEFKQLSDFALAPTENNVSFPEYLTNYIFPYSKELGVPDSYQFSYENNFPTFAETLTPPSLPQITQWSEVAKAEWVPALLPYRLEISNGPERKYYEIDGDIPISGKMWVTPPLKKPIPLKYDYSINNSQDDNNGVQYEVREHYRNKFRELGWDELHSGVTYQGRITYLPHQMIFQNVKGCYEDYSYVGVTKEAFRILIHISASPSCRQGDEPYSEYREYVFVSDELSFTYLDSLRE